MKQCSKCGITKPLEEFYKMVGMRDGHRNDCKACNLAEKALRYRDNPSPARERMEKWKRDNPQRYAARQAGYRASGKKRIYDRRSHLKRKFGISREDYDQLLASQDGTCAICGRAPRDDIALHVDHEHGTGRIRGLLCFRCDNALGDFTDHPDLLVAAASYLGPVPKDPALERRLAELKASAN